MDTIDEDIQLDLGEKNKNKFIYKNWKNEYINFITM